MRRVGLTMLGVALCVLIAACGSSGDSKSSSTAKAGGGGGGSSGNCATQTAAAVNQAKQPQTITYPSSLNMKKLAGKTFYFIPETLSNPVDVGVAQGFKAATAAAGIKGVVYPANGTTSSFNSALAQAIGAHPAAILMYAIGPSYVSSELKRAKAQGIPVIAGGEPASPLVPGYTNFAYAKTGKLEADFALSTIGCSGNIGIITANEFQNIETEANAAKSEVSAQCPNCSAAITNVDLTQMATQLGPQTKNLILRDPNLKFFIAGFDAAAQYMVPAVQQAHSKVQLVGNTGVPANLAFVKDGNVQIGDFNFLPNPVEGWQEVDQASRLILKMPVATAWEKVPPQLITQDNYATASKSPGWANYETKFKRMWGIG